MKNIWVNTIIFFLVGCSDLNKTYSVDDFISMMPEKFEYYVFAEGKVIQNKSIDSKDSEYQTLINRLKNDKKIRPKHSIISYAPIIIYHSENISFNLRNCSIIINFLGEKGKWMQMIIVEKNKEIRAG